MLSKLVAIFGLFGDTMKHFDKEIPVLLRKIIFSLQSSLVRISYFDFEIESKSVNKVFLLI